MKPWTRRIFITAVAVVVVLCAALFGFRRWGLARLARASEQFETDVGLLDRSVFLLPELEDGENAATWLLSGAEGVEISEEQGTVLNEALAVPTDEWSPELREAVAEFLDSNSTNLSLLERALPLGDSSYGIRYDEGVHAAKPDLIALRRAGRLTQLDARFATLQQDATRLQRDIAILDRLAESLSRESMLITALIAISLDRLLIETAHGVVLADDVAPELLKDLRRRLQDRDRAELLRTAVAHEGTMAATTPMAELSSVELDLIDRVLGSAFEPHSAAMLLEGYTDLANNLDQPYSAISDFYYADEAALRSWNTFGMLLPYLLDVIGRVKVYETSRMLALGAIELRLACLDRGEYPIDLGSDLYEPYAAGPISYELEDSGESVLMAPQAIELWNAESSETSELGPPPLTWNLPACSSPTA